MLARHAESMFWGARYLERAEDTARTLHATFRSSVSVGPGLASQRYRNLLTILRVSDPRGQLSGRQVLEYLVVDAAVEGSIRTSVSRARENVRALREQVPSELWEHTNRLHLRLRQPEFAADLLTEPLDRLDEVKERCQTIAGIVATSMSRTEGHQFLMLGQMLERALMSIRLLQVRYPLLDEASYDETALTLRSASGLEAYQRAHRASADPAEVAKFLLLSDQFPRSLLFCLRFCERRLIDLGSTIGSSLALRMFGQARSRLEFADIDELLGDLQGSLADVEDSVRHAAEAIAAQFFRQAEELDLHSQLLLPGGAR